MRAIHLEDRSHWQPIPGSAVTLTDTTAIELPALTVASLSVTSGGTVTVLD